MSTHGGKNPFGCMESRELTSLDKVTRNVTHALEGFRNPKRSAEKDKRQIADEKACQHTSYNIPISSPGRKLTLSRLNKDAGLNVRILGPSLFISGHQIRRTHHERKLPSAPLGIGPLLHPHLRNPSNTTQTWQIILRRPLPGLTTPTTFLLLFPKPRHDIRPSSSLLTRPSNMPRLPRIVHSFLDADGDGMGTATGYISNGCTGPRRAQQRHRAELGSGPGGGGDFAFFENAGAAKEV